MGVYLDDRDPMHSPQPEQEQRVSPLELFFDLAVVFGITQVTSLLSHDPTALGLLKGMLVLGVLWWAWAGYAWLTNLLDPEEGGVRIAVFTAMAAVLIVSLSVEQAFGRNGVLFGAAYFVVRALLLVLFAVAGRGKPELLRNVIKITPVGILGPGLLIVAGTLDGTAQLALWGLALLVDYLGVLIGDIGAWRISLHHLVERYGLVMIIALGESIFAIGIALAGSPLTVGVIMAASLGIAVSAALWWSYFDWVGFAGQAKLAEETGAARAALARDAYSYLHLPMVAGIVLFAFGLEATLVDVGGSLSGIHALGLSGGIAIYLIAHVALRLRFRGGFGRGRPIAAILLLAFIPVAIQLPALGALGVVASVCVLLITYEVLWHRESRAFIRGRRGQFTLEEVERIAAEERVHQPSVLRRRSGRRTRANGP
jgi:low temperature requirement protein LtrA